MSMGRSSFTLSCQFLNMSAGVLRGATRLYLPSEGEICAESDIGTIAAGILFVAHRQRRSPYLCLEKRKCPCRDITATFAVSIRCALAELL
jgi:hypothetical protein